MSHRDEITGLLLAGGAGRRVQGRDKGLLAWRELTLVEHLIGRLGPQVDRLLISCNRNFDSYGEFGLQIVADTRADYQGPLAGLEAAAAMISSDYTLIAPCDVPMLPRDLGERLLEVFEDSRDQEVDICFADDGSHKQYLCAMMRTSCLASLTSYLDAGERSVHNWYAQHHTVAVDFSDCVDAFRNLNHLN